ncbi:Phosphatidylinositol 4-phosphate 5-kinase-like protein 1 [Channa argus]|uniref:Phosphatidylinositol 4-phosphate 5-kinase-like protein 1 n=1 Tax=Channa argus TaxID=215402 RepID=A0A6G1QJH3_CHAAH|nr:Phosphatidylinositol 4-phosphate 5-kinase-like protein 1 [Channa argus]
MTVITQNINALMSAATGSLGMSSHRQHSRAGKRRQWGGLRQQWKLLGLFQIDQQHEFYSLTCMMKEGLATAIQNTTGCTPTKYFIVMQSVFYPDDRISARYDIKGCEVSRWTEPAPEGSQIIVVFKDLNFEGQYITLERQRPWLLRQMEIDTSFLQRLNVLDYSLLLAHQPLQKDERHQSPSFATLIMRTKKSVKPGSSPVDVGIAAVSWTVPEDAPTAILSETECICLNRPQTGDASNSSLLQMCSKHTGIGSNADDLQDFSVQNRRLLPNLKNPLHVIDGPEQRYFIGIIDIFTVYSFKKKLEHLWKRLRHPGRSFSTVSPQTYSVRLCQWVKDHTN